MPRDEFRKSVRVGSTLVLITSGVEVRVEAIDDVDDSFLDSFGVWHGYEEADFAQYAC